jgi:hypothetical protein
LRSLSRAAEGRTMRSRVLGAATFFLSLQLLAAASAHGQGLQPPTPPKARPPDTSIAHNVVTWFHHITGTGGHRHRIVSSPPLPRPRPAQLTKAPELPAAAVQPNEARPASTAVEPNKISPTPAPAVEQDKAPAELPAAAVEPNEAPPAAAADEPNVGSPGRAHTAAGPDGPPGNLPAAAVEPKEAQPAAFAVEPNVMSSTPTVEPDKTPAELPPGAVEQTKAPGTPTGTVLQGANIPD